ncbi:MAG: hypothetical protein P8P30_07695 [Rickettsiales bacterium]|nr:hypothetical protein [Rickettsiales bacterium]
MIAQLTKEQTQTLRTSLGLSVPQLKTLVQDRFNELVTEAIKGTKAPGEAKAFKILSTEFHQLSTTLSDDKNLPDLKDHKGEIANLLSKLSPIREQKAQEYNKLKEEHKNDPKKYGDPVYRIGSEYLAEERDLVQATAQKIFSYNSLPPFITRSIEDQIKNQVRQEGSEGAKVFKTIESLTLEVTGTKKEKIAHYDLEEKRRKFEKTQVKGIAAISAALAAELKKFGFTPQNLEYINLPDGLADRFKALEGDEITISTDDLKTAAKKIAQKIHKNDNAIDLLDNAANTLYETASFKKTHTLKQHFRSRLGQPIQSPSTHDRDVRSTLTAIGAGLVLSGTANIASQIISEKEAERAAALREKGEPVENVSTASSVVFKTVISTLAIIGVGFIIDGAMGGKHTKRLIEMISGQGAGRGV